MKKQGQNPLDLWDATVREIAALSKMRRGARVIVRKHRKPPSPASDTGVVPKIVACFTGAALIAVAMRVGCMQMSAREYAKMISTIVDCLKSSDRLDLTNYFKVAGGRFVGEYRAIERGISEMTLAESRNEQHKVAENLLDTLAAGNTMFSRSK
jgi:hypothetical protein